MENFLTSSLIMPRQEDLSGEKSSIAKTVHVDGGAFVEPPQYEFHDAYFSVCDDEGKLIHFENNIGDVYSGLAEYEAIKWAVENINDRLLRVTSDCSTAISWAKKGSSKKSKYRVPRLNLSGIELVYQRGNYADQWNAKNHSPKHDKSFYVKRYFDSLKNSSVKISAAAIKNKTTRVQNLPITKNTSANPRVKEANIGRVKADDPNLLEKFMKLDEEWEKKKMKIVKEKN